MIIAKYSSMNTSYFGIEEMNAGDMVSGELNEGELLAAHYDGDCLLGMVLNDVVSMDNVAVHSIAPNMVYVGSKITIMESGKLWINNPKDKFELHDILTIGKKGKFKKRKKKKQKAIATVIDIRDEQVLINFNRLGI